MSARIPFPDIAAPTAKSLADQIIAERGSLLDLYRMLLHSPPVAAGWLRYLTAIRHQCALPGPIRELVIMQISLLNGSSYEAEQHGPVALSEGVSGAQLSELRDWRRSATFNSREKTALAYAEEMTRNIRVPKAIFEAVQHEFDAQMLVELTATIAAYNMVSRFLEALEIHAEHI